MADDSQVIASAIVELKVTLGALDQQLAEAKSLLQKHQNDTEGILGGINESIKEVGDSYSQMFSFGNIASVAVELFAAKEAFNLLKEAVTESIQAFSAMEDATTKLNLVLGNTGEQAGLSAEAMTGMADQMSQISGVAVSTIVNAEALASTFQHVDNPETFKQLMTASMDVAALWGGDVTSAATGLARALDNPANAARALRQEHIYLTKTEQESLKAMKDAGDVLGAQKLILDKVASATRGAADAMGDNLTVETKKAKTAWEEYGVYVGGLLSGPLKSLMEFTKDSAGVAMEFTQKLIAGFKVLGDLMGGVVLAAINLLHGNLTGASNAMSAAWDKAGADAITTMDKIQNVNKGGLAEIRKQGQDHAAAVKKSIEENDASMAAASKVAAEKQAALDEVENNKKIAAHNHMVDIITAADMGGYDKYTQLLLKAERDIANADATENTSDADKAAYKVARWDDYYRQVGALSDADVAKQEAADLAAENKQIAGHNKVLDLIAAADSAGYDQYTKLLEQMQKDIENFNLNEYASEDDKVAYKLNREAEYYRQVSDYAEAHYKNTVAENLLILQDGATTADRKIKVAGDLQKQIKDGEADTMTAFKYGLSDGGTASETWAERVYNAAKSMGSNVDTSMKSVFEDLFSGHMQTAAAYVGKLKDAMLKSFADMLAGWVTAQVTQTILDGMHSLWKTLSDTTAAAADGAASGEAYAAAYNAAVATGTAGGAAAGGGVTLASAASTTGLVPGAVMGAGGLAVDSAINNAVIGSLGKGVVGNAVSFALTGGLGPLFNLFGGGGPSRSDGAHAAAVDMANSVIKAAVAGKLDPGQAQAALIQAGLAWEKQFPDWQNIDAYFADYANNGLAAAYPNVGFQGLINWQRQGNALSMTTPPILPDATGASVVVNSLTGGMTTWLPHLAEGGVVTRPTIALIGEKGPEAVVPLSGPNAPAVGNGQPMIVKLIINSRELASVLLDMSRTGQLKLDTGALITVGSV